MKKFPASIPRRMFMSHNVGKLVCPLCRSELEEEYHTYLLLAWEEDVPVEFITGTDGGYFCPNCPTIILDTEKFAQLAKTGIRTDSNEVQFAVVGLVDMEAIPEDKRHIPLGEDDNPIPLVEFINIVKASQSPKERAKERAKKRRKQQKKRR